MLPTTPPAPLRHPRASREVRLGDVMVAYEFKRSHRRSIGFSVGPDGLAVRAPRWAALRDVDAALQSKSTWIMRKLHEARARHARQATQATEWRDGAQLPYLGQTLTVRLDPAFGGVAGGAELTSVDPAHLLLRISLAHGATPQQVRDRVQAWLLQQARQLFQARLDHFAPLLGVQWQRLSLSNVATRWGSASANGSIRLNWRLLHFSPAVVDYVVVHELSHLRVMDHSPRFWQTVAAVVPDYLALRQQLKTEVAPGWG
ncbi:MAG: SprT family zinc-dependent metalloprotease [Rhodoferax sp.]|nr:SprT family zinc-dependent metalloprotease [Rhodoferax sp.]